MKLKTSYFGNLWINNTTSKFVKANKLISYINKKVIVKHKFSLLDYSSSHYIIGIIKDCNVSEDYYKLSIIKDGKKHIQAFPISDLEFLAIEEQR